MCKTRYVTPSILRPCRWVRKRCTQKKKGRDLRATGERSSNQNSQIDNRYCSWSFLFLFSDMEPTLLALRQILLTPDPL